MASEHKRKLSIELRVSIIYLVLGSLWILFSDRLVLKMESDSYHIYLMSTYKGWFFIFITSILLFLLVRKESVKRDFIYNELLRANKKAHESDQLKSAFLSNLSHYIRTPMNSILGFVELLEYRNLDLDKRNKFMSIIDEQSQELLQLINNMVEVAKIQQGLMEIENTKFLLNELVRKLYVTYESKLCRWKPGINLILVLAMEDKQDLIVGDYNKIQIVFSNLLSNSVKFTSYGKIEFGYRIINSEIECFVNDTGKGIADEKKEQILSDFMHSNHNLQDVNEGSSLGLYLSSGLTRSMGGKLWLDYSDNTGSQFKFNFPYQKG